MVFTQVRRTVALGPEEAFARLTRWEDHAVPFTSVRRTELGFVARTGIGPFGFDDPMDVVDLQPPEFCRLEKRGRIVRGWAELAVEPVAAGSRVTWSEELSIIALPHWLDPFVSRATAAMIGQLLRRTIGS